MSIHSLIKSENPVIHDERNIRTIINYFSTINQYDTFEVTPTEALAFTGDLFGLLRFINPNIDSVELYSILAMNNIPSSQDYDGVTTLFKIPLQTNLDKIKKLLR